ncbi:Alpha-xylosidase 1 [Camellia lanceoleosa]|nr:Alpha-xylosidase 1 [Camellia lanceoleosa]
MASSLIPIFFVALIVCGGVVNSASNSASTIPTKIGKGYRLISIEESPDGGLVGHLQIKEKNSIYGPDIPHLQLHVKHETDNRLRVHITDAEKQRWEVPYTLLPRDQPTPSKQTIGRSRKTHYTADPFAFSVKRKSNGQTLFNSSSDQSDPYGDLVFKDQYLEISTKLPEDASLYGLGENTQPHGIKLYPNDPYTLYTLDVSAINLNTDLYGSHPVYMDLRNVGGEAYAHGVLLMNSNGMDVDWGILDFYFFSGPSPLDVVDQYTALIGRPAPMPYWALGFHQCRWGYHNLSVVEDVVENYKRPKSRRSIGIPRKIHSQGMNYIVLIHPGIADNSSYGVYQRGIADDVFIKYEGKPYLAQVWPGAVNFLTTLIRKLLIVPVDGLWIDMNEVNFCSGLCTIPKGKQCPTGSGPGWICCLDCKNITKTRWDEPPYKINASGLQVPIGYKTIATSAVHYNGVLEYDAHSLYGFSETIATHKALQGLEGKRPFILSRPLLLVQATMLRIDDICGFYPAPTEELCNRWIEVGAFTPFQEIMLTSIPQDKSFISGTLWLSLLEMLLGMVKVWSDVQDGKFALENHWIIEKVTVLGLDGIGGAFAIKIDGNPVVDTSKVEISATEQKYPQGLGDGGDMKKSTMIEVKGLDLPVGKKFTMSWKMGISG